MSGVRFGPLHALDKSLMQRLQILVRVLLQDISGQHSRPLEQQHLPDHVRAADENDISCWQACRRNILLPAVAAAAAACSR